MFLFHLTDRNFAEIYNLRFVRQFILYEATRDQQHLVVIHDREAHDGPPTGQPASDNRIIRYAKQYIL